MAVTYQVTDRQIKKAPSYYMGRKLPWYHPTSKTGHTCFPCVPLTQGYVRLSPKNSRAAPAVPDKSFHQTLSLFGMEYYGQSCHSLLAYTTYTIITNKKSLVNKFFPILRSLQAYRQYRHISSSDSSLFRYETIVINFSYM